MDFGKLQNLSTVDFTLPPTHPQTLRVLSKQVASKSIEWIIGGDVWVNPKWKGTLYPAKAKANEYLKFYGRQLKCIELNASFYKIYESKKIEAWVKQVPDDFKFFPKFYREITHERSLSNCDEITKYFLESISYFGEKLGIPFLQLPPSFSTNLAPYLISFLKLLPQDLQIAVEFRHPSWFSTQPVVDEVFSLIEAENHIVLITASPGRRDVIHMRLTTSTLFLRFAGCQNNEIDIERVERWFTKIEEWRKQGLQKVCWFIHKPDGNEHAPELLKYLFNKIGNKLTLHNETEQGYLF